MGKKAMSRYALWVVLSLAAGVPGVVQAADSDLSSGLRNLREGAQLQAEQDFVRYRDGERDADMRRRIERILPLLKRPLSPEVREYIAGTVEDAARARAQRAARPGYLVRMFPVFP